MTVYIDVLLLENIAINFVILAVTSHFSRAKASLTRLLIGASIGAIYVLVVLLPGFQTYFTLLAKLMLSFLIIAVTFWPEKLKEFIRVTTIFYLVSFVFGGAAFALFYFSKSGGTLYNGVYYIDSFPVKTLIAALIIAYLVIRISWDFVRSKLNKENIMVPVSIKFKDRAISMKALIDTGNSLKDPISNLPVIVVEFSAVKEILPDEICKLFDGGNENNFELLSTAVESSDWASRFRLIPFTSLGQENGMLVGFKPDGIEIGNDIQSRNHGDVIVGIYNRHLSRDQSYEALLGLELVS